jgi:hypothetical protein
MENEAQQQPPRPQEKDNGRQAPSYNDIRQNIRTIKTVIRIARLASNPVVIWTLVGIFIAIVIYMLFFSSAGALPFGGGSSSSQQTPTAGTGTPKTPPIPGLTLILTGPNAVDNGTNIEYSVSVSYDKTLTTTPIENITVYLDVPINSTFVRTTGSDLRNGNIISWPLSDTQNQSSFAFVLNPSINDVTLPVKVYAKTNGGSGSTASANNCGGKYALDNPIGNFGDPVCNFTKDDLYTLLQSLDPANASRWYTIIVPCEAPGYNSNAYNPNSYSGSGAYGLFQMNPSNHGYNPLDAGDVEWRQQTQNAISYSKLIPSLGAYWACAQ